MRQNRGQGSIKVDAYLSLLRFMRAHIDHATSDLFSRSRIAQSEQLSSRTIAPRAFTVTVRVSSETGLFSAPSSRTITETLAMTR